MTADRDSAATGTLRGAAVLVTRPDGEERDLLQRIEALGGIGIHQPGIELRSAAADEPTLERLRAITAGDWLIFTSPAAVRHGVALLGHGVPAGVRLWAVGQRSAADLRAAGFEQVHAPVAAAGSEALLAEPSFAAPHGRRILILGARGGRLQLQRTLTARGARVLPVYVYRRAPPRLSRPALKRLREHFDHSIVTATSAEILRQVTALFQDRLPAPLTTRPLVVVSRRIATAASELGYTRVAISEGPSLAPIVDAVRGLAGAW